MVFRRKGLVHCLVYGGLQDENEKSANRLHTTARAAWQDGLIDGIFLTESFTELLGPNFDIHHPSIRIIKDEIRNEVELVDIFLDKAHKGLGGPVAVITSWFQAPTMAWLFLGRGMHYLIPHPFSFRSWPACLLIEPEILVQSQPKDISLAA